MVQKLQYLPIQYAAPHEAIVVSELPPHSDPRLCLLEHPLQTGPLETWGASLAIARWAALHQIPYRMPSWDVVREVNSKVFSFLHAPKLPGAALLTTPWEARAWIEKTAGPKVLKTPQGVAGRGHFHLDGKRDLSSFLKQHPILIGEPWMERILDFSTQWKIDEGEIQYLGATILKNRPNGTYLSNTVCHDFGDYHWALEEHLRVAKELLEKIKRLQFFGHLGIDAFLYRSGGREILHPVVEINARKTMGWVALQMAIRYKNSN